jgi:Fe-S cluster biosynthesis and repair protein YggX
VFTGARQRLYNNITKGGWDLWQRKSVS